MSVLSSMKRKLFIKGANGKKYPTEAVQKARAKDPSESEFYKAILRREERKRLGARS